MDGFLKRKNDVLLKLDKSSKGGWDEKIRDLCEEINSLENYYTTSSCSGRVVLMRDCDEKQAGLFNWVCHDEFGFEELKGELGTICPSNLPRPPNSRLGSESLPPTRLRSAQTKIVRTKTLAPDLCSLRSQIGSVDNGEEILVNCVSAEKSGEADFGADNRATLERGNLDTLRAYPETFSS
jgi:hypothetical protein